MTINNLYQQKAMTERMRFTTIHANGGQQTQDTDVVFEHSLSILLNEQLAFSVICSPSHLLELAVGRLLSARLIDSVDDLESVYLCEKGNTAKFFLKETVSMDRYEISKEAEPTCCTGNRSRLSRKENKLRMLPQVYPKKESIFSVIDVFANGSKIHKMTKGVHCCYLGYKGEVLFAGEDLGRHNLLKRLEKWGLG